MSSSNSTFKLREPDDGERQWLDIGSRDSMSSYLKVLGFYKVGCYYEHGLLTADICRTLEGPQDILEYMIQHGIPNLEALHHKDKMAFEWFVRCTHLDWNIFKNAEQSLRNLKPEMTTKIVTDKSLMEILEKNKVKFGEDGRIYLAGVSSSEDCQLEGVHYATILGQLRTMIRKTGSWGARGGGKGTCAVAEKLVVQLWAACGPTPIPVFGGADQDGRHLQDAEGVLQSERFENHGQAMRTSETHRPSVPMAHLEESDDISDLGERGCPVPYSVHSKAIYRGNEYKRLLKEKNDELQQEVACCDKYKKLVDQLLEQNGKLQQKAALSDKYEDFFLQFKEKSNELHRDIARMCLKRKRDD